MMSPDLKRMLSLCIKAKTLYALVYTHTRILLAVIQADNLARSQRRLRTNHRKIYSDAIGDEYCLPNGKRTSLYCEYTASGQLLTIGYFKNGLRHGLFELWDRNGYISYRGLYLEGYREDVWENYYYEGRLISRFQCMNGKLHGPCYDWDRHGRLSRRCNYVNDKIEGLNELFYYNVADLSNKIMTFENGQQHGITSAWYPNGNLKFRENWVRDKKTGLREEWHPDGRLQRRYNLIDGAITSFEEWDGQGNLINKY